MNEEMLITSDQVMPEYNRFGKLFARVSRKINNDFKGEYEQILQKNSRLSAQERNLISYVCAQAIYKKQQKEQEVSCQDLKESETE